MYKNRLIILFTYYFVTHISLVFDDNTALGNNMPILGFKRTGYDRFEREQELCSLLLSKLLLNVRFVRCASLFKA